MDEILCLSDSVDRLAEAVEDLNGLIREQWEWKVVVPSEQGFQSGLPFQSASPEQNQER